MKISKPQKDSWLLVSEGNPGENNVIDSIAMLLQYAHAAGKISEREANNSGCGFVGDDPRNYVYIPDSQFEVEFDEDDDDKFPSGIDVFPDGLENPPSHEEIVEMLKEQAGHQEKFESVEV